MRKISLDAAIVVLANRRRLNPGQTLNADVSVDEVCPLFGEAKEAEDESETEKRCCLEDNKFLLKTKCITVGFSLYFIYFFFFFISFSLEGLRK